MAEHHHDSLRATCYTISKLQFRLENPSSPDDEAGEVCGNPQKPKAKRWLDEFMEAANMEDVNNG